MPKLRLNQDTYAVLLSHDPKIDDQALHLLLRSEVAYIGCLGSRKTHAKRLKRLEEAGFTSDETDRIYAPVGVNIHAKTPQEIALSVMAQVVEIKNNEEVG
ncbi:XdhC/CoxI family protein [Microscilla marina ATCC 23134]|uniref:XdhC/CoxI family protein n=1 Tax=Microscilla marina ATCC 23134 TaxID=313606 RepID=A1ZZL0_MICM2|nr:XdhC/CoxI family protein [Microscilla marina ATCC 23134]